MVDRSAREDLSLHSSDAFLKNLIDYAGLFPPTQLPLGDAIRNYASYLNDADYWILGPFVNPAVDLHGLDQYMSLFTEVKPLSISALGRKGKDNQESLMLLKKDLKTIESFREKHGKKVAIDFFELPLPSIKLSAGYLTEISKIMVEYKLSCYCELPINSEDSFWETDLKDAIAKIARQNKNLGSLLSVKLRTGGIRADLIPSLEIVASFIYRCKEYKIPAKFTAGLHHPLRMYRNEVQTNMHGYLNVFIAGLMAYAHNLDTASILKILSDEESKNFFFKEDKLVWKDLAVTTKEIKELRGKYLCSYGSCNFVEPREELKELNIIERG